MDRSGYKFFQNRDCEFFPCHNVENVEEFSCLPWFCPLYALGENCGGCPTYTDKGLKDCSNCTLPHLPGGYEHVMGRMEDMMELVRKK